jgi:hypothetical protein
MPVNSTFFTLMQTVYFSGLFGPASSSQRAKRVPRLLEDSGTRRRSGIVATKMWSAQVSTMANTTSVAPNALRWLPIEQHRLSRECLGDPCRCIRERLIRTLSIGILRAARHCPAIKWLSD